MSGQRAVVLAVAAGAAALAAACAEVSTAPSAVVSLAFDTSTVAVVAGDTLRDTLGGVLPLRAVAFNAAEDTVTGATPAYVVAPADTGPVRLVGPLAIGVRARSTAVRVFAAIGELQSLPKSVYVIRRPERLADSSARDSVRYGSAVVTVRSEARTPVQVTADSAGTPVGVPRVVVRFAVEHAAPAVADSVVLVDDRNVTVTTTGVTIIPRSTLDTTEANGRAGRRLLVFRRAAATGRDSVIVRAVAAYPAALPGSLIAADTVRYTVLVVP